MMDSVGELEFYGFVRVEHDKRQPSKSLLRISVDMEELAEELEKIKSEWDKSVCIHLKQNLLLGP